MVGGAITVRLAVAMFPVPPLAEDTWPVVFVYAPAVAPVTVTEYTHWPFTGIVTPPTLIVFELTVKAPLPKPQGSLTTLFGVVSPLGRGSINVTGLRATVFAGGFVMVNVSVVVPFSGMLVGLNTLAATGGATTVIGAVLLVVPVPPSVEVIAPVVLLASPAVVPFTSTFTVQELL